MFFLTLTCDLPHFTIAGTDYFGPFLNLFLPGVAMGLSFKQCYSYDNRRGKVGGSLTHSCRKCHRHC